MEVESIGWILDEDGDYSLVDVQKVDMEKFPQFATLPFWKFELQPGDCIYIPLG